MDKDYILSFSSLSFSFTKVDLFIFRCNSKFLYLPYLAMLPLWFRYVTLIFLSVHLSILSFKIHLWRKMVNPFFDCLVIWCSRNEMLFTLCASNLCNLYLNKRFYGCSCFISIYLSPGFCGLFLSPCNINSLSCKVFSTNFLLLSCCTFRNISKRFELIATS